MAKPRAEEYPDHPKGSVPDILGRLVQRDGRSMRAISIGAGLAPDAIRNVLRGTSAAPRPRTLAALAKSLGVPLTVIECKSPIPPAAKAPPAAADHPSAPTPAPRRQASTSPAAKAHSPGGEDPRRVLRAAVSAALRAAVEAGVQPRIALADAVLAGMLAGVRAGLDDVEAAEIIGNMGIPERI